MQRHLQRAHHHSNRGAQAAACPPHRHGAAAVLNSRRRAQCRCVSPSASQSQVQVSIHQAATPAELRAAGYLRATSFYTYPADRSEYAARMHRRMKGDAEWHSVTQKVEGTEPDYKDLVVRCFIATLPDGTSLAQQISADMDLSTKLPAEPERGGTGGGGGAAHPPRLVVGSLDVNQGPVLPAEELVGRQGAGQQRAYLSNVCVAAAARRLGIAAQLIAAAEEWAAAAGVQYMYVHVVPTNTPAVQLYSRLGYTTEAEESAGTARALGRPRRLLLQKRL